MASTIASTMASTTGVPNWHKPGLWLASFVDSYVFFYYLRYWQFRLHLITWCWFREIVQDLIRKEVVSK